MNNVHGMQRFNRQHQIGDIILGISLLQINLLLQQTIECPPAAEIQDEEVQVLLPEGVVQLDVVLPVYAPVYLLLLLEGFHALLVYLFELHHLHRVQVLCLLLRHQVNLTIRPTSQLLYDLEI